MVTNEATVMTVISTTDITTSDSTRLKPGRRGSMISLGTSTHVG